MLDRGSAACCAAMAGIYRQVLERIAADPYAALHTRVSLPLSSKLLLVAKTLARRNGTGAAR
jgi:phytoene synthase